MREAHTVRRVLVEHFFRRFFDSDTIQVDGETLTTVIRAVSAAAVPGLMVAFFMQNQYPGRSPWGAIEDQYFFVLFSFVLMGAVAIFEWEMLFPDRLDFLILSPLPVKPLQMLAAKAAALLGFLSLFVVSGNCFAALILSLIREGSFYRQIYAHSVAVLLAGLFASLFFLALGGVLLCVLGAAGFRALSPVIQMVSVAALLLLMVHYGKVGYAMQGLLAQPLGLARWVPPLWFLGLYEVLLRGDAAPPFASRMAPYAIYGTLVMAAIVVVTYPMAWARMRRLAIEGSSTRQQAQWLQQRLAAMTHRFIRRPGERAAFHFIAKTISRNNRYQVYLAMYCGTGLALAVASAVVVRRNSPGIHPALSDQGLHAVMPLLLFWIIAGLRTAFAFPLNLPAGWIFRVSGVDVNECAAAARTWVFLCGVTVMCMVLAALRIAGWGPQHLLVQFVCGLCLCILLTDGFFFFRQAVPFNQPRMPGKTSLPLMLTLYVGVFPLFIFGVIYLERKLEMNLKELAVMATGVAMIHGGLALVQNGPVEVEEEMEGYEGEFQLLGLSRE